MSTITASRTDNPLTAGQLPRYAPWALGAVALIAGGVIDAIVDPLTSALKRAGLRRAQKSAGEAPAPATAAVRAGSSGSPRKAQASVGTIKKAKPMKG